LNAANSTLTLDACAPASSAHTLARNGYAVVENVLDASQCREIAVRLETRNYEGPGSRRLIQEAWCAALGAKILGLSAFRSILPPTSVAVQCILFDKSPERNWLVALHQDLSIPVAQRIDSDACSGWSEKDGMTFVQPPISVLESVVAVRLHLDPCPADSGALRVVPGSQRWGRLSPGRTEEIRREHGEVTVEVSQGGALVMRPLLLHASSKASKPVRRRVLHFVFGPRELPLRLRWAQAFQ